MTKENDNKLILVGVCTHNRPEMLRRCLTTITRQNIPIGTEIIICVADNNSNADYKIKDIVKESLIGFNFEYIFVEQRGISYARNAIIEIGVKRDADYFAFMDDDQYAVKGWLENFYKKITNSNVDVVQGKVIYDFPESVLDSVKQERNIEIAEEAIMKNVCTGNVIFKGKLVKDWGLRFDERLALTGGEDVDFFFKSKRRGGKHIYTNNAVVHEAVTLERSTLKSQFMRIVTCGFSMCYVMYINHGMVYVLWKYSIKSLKNIIISPLYLLWGKLFGKEKIKFKGIYKFFYAVGCLAFIFNIKLESYKKTIGY